MALGSTQPSTEMSTRSISWGKGGRCVRLTTLPPSCVVTKSGNLNFLEPSRPVQACNGTDFFKGKGKGTAAPVHATIAYGTVQLYIHSALISKWNTVKWSISCHSHFATWKRTPVHTCRNNHVRPSAGPKAWKKQIPLPYIDARHPGCPAPSTATTSMHQTEMRDKLHTPVALLHEVQSAVSMGGSLAFPKKYRNTALSS